MKSFKGYISFLLGAVLLVFIFQNCGQPGMIIKAEDQNKLAVCDGVSCNLDPLTDKPAVTTILMALGDEANQQLVVNGSSAQLVAETVVRFSSPQKNPKILVVRDHNINGEDPEDTVYVSNVLLKRYNAAFLEESASGLTSKDVEGYDVIWFNNPGHPMSSQTTRDTLLAFSGAVILQGDDLSRGVNFSLEMLTGLHFIDNGTDVVCDGKSYPHNDNLGEQYRVSLSASLFPQVSDSVIHFRYGNDIDKTSVTNKNIEVLAVAQGGPEVCKEERPAIVRYLK